MTENHPIFRCVSEGEEKIILSSLCESFGESVLDALDKYQFWLKEGKIKEVFAVPQKDTHILERISQNVYSAGIPFGSIWNSEFQLEIEGASLLSSFINNVIHIKTDQFLFGKPIFIENIEKIDADFQKGDLLLIYGKKGLHYGIGKAVLDSVKILTSKSNTVVIRGYKNKPFDRGWYLREGN